MNILLGKKLKPQSNIAKKQYQKLDHTFEFNKIIKKEEPTFNNYNKSNLIYNSKYSFYKYYRDSKKFDNLSFKLNYSFLYEFLNDLNEFNKRKIIKEIAKKKKTNVRDTALELYKKLLGAYFDEYYYLSDTKRKKVNSKYKPKNLFIKGYNYNDWYENVEPSDKEESVDISDMPPIGGDE